MSTDQSPQVAKLSGDVKWDDGTNFNGYFVVGLRLPTDGANDWPYLFRGTGDNTKKIKIRMPLWFPIPINNAEFNDAIGLFYNADMVPHNSEYIGYYYDDTLKRIAGPTIAFVADAPTITPPIPPLPSPIVGASTPVPDV